MDLTSGRLQLRSQGQGSAGFDIRDLRPWSSDEWVQEDQLWIVTVRGSGMEVGLQRRRSEGGSGDGLTLRFFTIEAQIKLKVKVRHSGTWTVGSECYIRQEHLEFNTDIS